MYIGAALYRIGAKNNNLC